MNCPLRTTLMTFSVAIVWGACTAFTWKAYIDPLTGMGLGGYIALVGFHIAIAGGITFSFCQRRRLLGSVLLLVALFLLMPLPSKRGIDIQITNTRSEAATITVMRTDNKSKHIMLSIPAGETILYRSAPGDYSEAIPLTIERATSSLNVIVADLRKQQLRLTENEILLTDILKK